MPEPGIYILTGPIRSGKTTSLMQWCSQRSDVYGVFTPDISGKRVFMDAYTGERFPMETIDEEETISIGRFAFSKKNFDKATQIIHDAIHKPGWIIIDEIGPLELRGDGFHDVLKKVLASRNDRLVIVVRERMAEKVKEYFGMITATVITNIDLL